MAFCCGDVLNQHFLINVIKVKKAVLRIITYNWKFEYTASIYINLKLMNIQWIQKYFVMVSTFRFQNSNYNRADLLKIQDHYQHSRTNHLNLVCPVYRTTLYTNSIFCVGLNMWNSMPNGIKNIVNSGTKNVFKHKLKKSKYWIYKISDIFLIIL